MTNADDVTEGLAREAFERFVESFNGDEAGDIDHVGAINGDTGFAMRGGNDVWAVMLKATQALLPTVRELQAGALERFGRKAYSLDPPAGMWQDAVWEAATDEAKTYREAGE